MKELGSELGCSAKTKEGSTCVRIRARNENASKEGAKLTILVLDQVRDNVSDESLRASTTPLESDEITNDLLVLDVESLDVVVHGRLFE